MADPILTFQGNSTRGAHVVFHPLMLIENVIMATKIPWIDIAASDGSFWLYKRTKTACPLANKTMCPQGGWTEMLARDGLGEMTLVRPLEYPSLYGRECLQR